MSNNLDPETDFYIQLSTQWATHLASIANENEQVAWLFEAVEKQIALFVQASPEKTNQTIACKKGCGHCCYQAVKTLPSIVRFILSQFSAEQQQELIGRFRQYEDNKGHSKQPCPFLVDQACSIYPHRPLSCRTFTSPDVEMCKRNLLVTTQIPQQAFRYQTYQAAMIALQAVAKKQQRDYEQVDFVSSLLAHADRQQ